MLYPGQLQYEKPFKIIVPIRDLIAFATVYNFEYVSENFHWSA